MAYGHTRRAQLSAPTPRNITGITGGGVIRLTLARVLRRWTQAELARRARLDAALVCRIERRQLVPYRVQLERLAAALGVPACRATKLLEEVSIDAMKLLN